ncbi:MAG: hypothetical protein WDN49_12025 [Acetobacteraceae bacterium]
MVGGLAVAVGDGARPPSWRWPPRSARSPGSTARYAIPARRHRAGQRAETPPAWRWTRMLGGVARERPAIEARLALGDTFAAATPAAGADRHPPRPAATINQMSAAGNRHPCRAS